MTGRWYIYGYRVAGRTGRSEELMEPIQTRSESRCTTERRYMYGYGMSG